MSDQTEQTVLLADIGGTYIRFALYDGRTMGQIGVFRHMGADSFETAYRAFLMPGQAKPASMIVGAAGIVQAGQVSFSNRSLTLSERDLKERYQLALCRIVNDFELQAYATLALDESDVLTVNKGIPDSAGARCVIGPGTGLGVCFLSGGETQALAHPSEAGHISLPCLPFADETGEKIERFLRGRFGRVSVERVLSGQGLPLLAAALSDGQGVFDSPEAVFNAAVAGDSLAKRTFDVFWAYLGAFCADMALTMKTTGGLYLTGDLLRRNPVPDWIQQSEFIRFFMDKGRFESFVRQVPVKLIRVPQTAFLGLKYLADRLIF